MFFDLNKPWVMMLTPVEPTPSRTAEDLSFLKTLYETTVQDLVQMEPCQLQTLILKTEALARWLKGISALSAFLDAKGR